MQIAVDQLTLGFNTQVLFQNLSLRADRGKRLCIAGPSGSGKSSLFRAFLGFVRPRHGSIFIDDTKLNEKTVWHLRRQIAYVPQEPDLGTMPVRQRIQEPFKLKANAHTAPAPSQLDAYWEQFGLGAGLMEKAASELSGGEKQRVAVIIALLLRRPILLLDEPVSAMDKQSRLTLRRMLTEQTDKTVLFISHDESLLDIADQIVDVTSFKGAS